MIICLGTTPAKQRTLLFDRVNPGAVNRAAQVHESAAGKSVNVARVLAILEEQALATGFLGGDRGRFIRQELDRDGVSHDFIDVTAPTRLCITVIDRAARTHTELVEESRPVEPGAWTALRSKLESLLPQGRMLILSGSLTPGAPQDFYEQCARLASAAGVQTIVDAQGAPLTKSLSARPFIVKPNRAEIVATLSLPDDSQASILDGMRQLIARGAGGVIVTMGPAGALAARGPEAWRIRIPAVEALNTIGSGDAFTAGLAAGLLRNERLPDACRLGAACGVANALTLLAAQVRPEDVRRLREQVRIEPL